MTSQSNTNLPKKEILQALVVVFFSIFIYLLITSFANNRTQTEGNFTQKGKCEPIVIDQAQLLAKNAIVYDLKNDCILFEKSKDERVPVASLTKIMTSIVAIENIPEETLIQINSEDLEKPDSQGLKEGDTFSLVEIIKLMLLTSSNDGAHAVSRYIGKYTDENTSTISLMNKKAIEIGMVNTVFYNESGLDEKDALGSVSSASDISKMISYSYTNLPFILETTSKESSTITKNEDDSLVYKNTNPFVESIPGIVMSKTGYTSESGGALGIVFERAPLHPVVIVVIGSTKEGRFEDVKILVNKVLDK